MSRLGSNSHSTNPDLAFGDSKGADGADGTNGTDGADGVGVPAGGTTGQHLTKIDNTDFNTEWTTPAGGGAALEVLYMRDEKASGTGGDAGAINNARDDLTLNTVKVNTITGSSTDTGAGTFTLPAGTYLISAKHGIYSTFVSGTELGARIYLVNNTDAVDEIVGINNMALADAGERGACMLSIDGAFVIADTKTFKMQRRRQNSNGATNTMFEANEATVIEAYLDVLITKIA